MAAKAERYGDTAMRSVEKHILLQTIDANWREHLVTLDHLRSVVGFRGYAQRDPLNEYKSEAFQLFETLLNRLRTEVTQKLAHVQLMTQEEQEAMMAGLAARQQAAQRASPAPAGDGRRRWRGAGAAHSTRGSTPTTRGPGAPAGATIPAPAARARSTSTATGGSEPGRGLGSRRAEALLPVERDQPMVASAA